MNDTEVPVNESTIADLVAMFLRHLADDTGLAATSLTLYKTDIERFAGYITDCVGRSVSADQIEHTEIRTFLRSSRQASLANVKLACLQSAAL